MPNHSKNSILEYIVSISAFVTAVLYLNDFLRVKFLTIVCLFGLIFLPITSYSEKILTLTIDVSEGGQSSERRKQQLKNYLVSKNCVVSTINFSKGIDSNIRSALVFLPLEQNWSQDYIKKLSIKVIDEEPLSTSILVRKSTGIDSIENLNRTRIALFSKNSRLGYKLPMELLKKSGVKITKDKIIYVQDNLAAVSLLMHKDVFTAVIASPLAKRWADSNDIVIIKQTKKLMPGGIWFRKDLPEIFQQSCGQAFSQLNKNERKDKKLLSIFPAWLDRLVIF